LAFNQQITKSTGRAADKSVEIWMEVHGRETSQPRTAAAIMQAAGHKNAALCWNANNADVINQSVEASFKLLRPWVRHVHIHDIVKDDYPYRELFTLLAKSGTIATPCVRWAPAPPPRKDFSGPTGPGGWN